MCLIKLVDIKLVNILDREISRRVSQEGMHVGRQTNVTEQFNME